MSADQQIKALADYIMANIPGEPSRSEGAGDCAVRLLTKYRDALHGVILELKVPQGIGYPITSASEVAADALGLEEGKEDTVSPMKHLFALMRGGLHRG